MINQEFLRAKYNPEGSELRNIQHQLMDLMMVLDGICRDNNIPYMLTGGNVLGAVRHGGFIPWDDDIDIALLDKDYKKLVKVLRNYQSDKYVLQEHRSDPDYVHTFPKFRVKEGNLLGANPSRGVLYKYKGVGIDIFCMSPISLLNARVSTYIHVRLLTWTYRIKNTFLRHLITDVLLFVVKILFCFCDILNIFHKPNEYHHAQAQGVIKTINYCDLLPYKRVVYDGEMLPVPQNTHNFLRVYFGPDYMELPKNIAIHNKDLINK